MVASREDLELAEEERKYPSLYDKTNPDYHKADLVENCWDRVQKILGVESRKIAKDNFIKLRKRFNKQRQKTKKAKKSGTSRGEMLEEAGGKELMKEWEFLSWLSPFIQTRRTKCNSLFQQDKSPENCSSSGNSANSSFSAHAPAATVSFPSQLKIKKELFENDETHESSNDESADSSESDLELKQDNVVVVKTPRFYDEQLLIPGGRGQEKT